MAACKQASRAELAATAPRAASHAMVLLDLVKAFERVPHQRLVYEALRLGYPCWLLRPSPAACRSLAACRQPRVLRIGAVYSHTLVATRGIAGGSGFASF